MKKTLIPLTFTLAATVGFIEKSSAFESSSVRTWVAIGMVDQPTALHNLAVYETLVHRIRDTAENSRLAPSVRQRNLAAQISDLESRVVNQFGLLRFVPGGMGFFFSEVAGILDHGRSAIEQGRFATVSRLASEASARINQAREDLKKN